MIKYNYFHALVINFAWNFDKRKVNVTFSIFRLELEHEFGLIFLEKKMKILHLVLQRVSTSCINASAKFANRQVPNLCLPNLDF